MRAGGMLCRSQAATAVCVPGDARSMVVARRAGGDDGARALHDVRYARLGGAAADGSGRRSASRRVAAPRASQGAAAAPPPPPPPPPPPAVVSSAASCKPRVEMARRRPGRAPVAVTLPMVTKSPSKEAPAKDLAAAAKRAAAAAPGDQVLQVRNVTDDLQQHLVSATVSPAFTRRIWRLVTRYSLISLVIY